MQIWSDLTDGWGQGSFIISCSPYPEGYQASVWSLPGIELTEISLFRGGARLATDKKDEKSGSSKLSKKLLVEKQRGTDNDLEVLKLILDENPSLRQRVLNKIKSIRNMNKV